MDMLLQNVASNGALMRPESDIDKARRASDKLKTFIANLDHDKMQEMFSLARDVECGYENTIAAATKEKRYSVDEIEELQDEYDYLEGYTCSFGYWLRERERKGGE